MKLVIDIDEKRFKDIQRIASIQIRRKSLTCEQIIANGTPLLEELEKIKIEVGRQGYYNKYDRKMVEQIIDNRISELKGENK